MKNKFLSNFFILSSSNIIALFLGIVTSIITARILGPENLGVKTLLINFPQLFVSFFDMGIRQSTIYYIGTNIYEQKKIVGTIMFIWIISSIFGLFCYGFLSYFQFTEINIILIVISACYIPIMIGQSFLTGILIGNNMIKSLAKFNLGNALTTPILTILFLIVFKWGIFGVLLAMQISSFFLLLTRFWILKKELLLKFFIIFDIEVIKNLVKKGALFAIALFLSTNLRLIPIYLMGGILDNYDIGIYSAGVSFAFLLYQMFNATGPILFAYSARDKNTQNSSLKTQMLLRIMFPIICIGAICLLFSMKYIVILMYGDKYIDSIPITQIMLIGIVFYSFYMFLVMDMAGKGKPIIAIKALLPSFILCILFNYIGIKYWGIIGAATSTTIALAVAGSSYLFQYSKEVNMSIWEIIHPRKSDWLYLEKSVKNVFEK